VTGAFSVHGAAPKNPPHVGGEVRSAGSVTFSLAPYVPVLASTEPTVSHEMTSVVPAKPLHCVTAYESSLIAFDSPSAPASTATAVSVVLYAL
jgi:hypothetical protein